MRQSILPHFHHGPPATGRPVQGGNPASLTASLEHIPIRETASIRLDNFPDFLILGPQRTGTTWLYHNLKKHPQVFLPRKKETFFFTTLTRPDHPHRHFDTLDDFLAGPMREPARSRLKRHYDCLRKYREAYRPSMRGEATATNALLPVPVIREITEIRPGMKAILMLRNPVERAWSHARKDLARNTGRSVEDVPLEEFERFFRASGQRALADYSAQVRHWSACLEPGHLFIGEFEMIATAPEKLLTGIHRFLGIRSGRKYFNRHLRERINAADGDSETMRQISAVPDEIRDSLTVILAGENQRYQQIRSTLDLTKIHRGIHSQPIRPAVSPPKPGTKRFDPAA